MGGRVAIEAGLRRPSARAARAARAVAGLAARPPVGAAAARRSSAARAPCSRRRARVVESIARRSVPGGDGWTAAGVDEFLRSYLTRRARRVLRRGAQHLPGGAARRGRLLDAAAAAAGADALFVWGKRDQLVPIDLRAPRARGAARTPSISSSTAATSRSSSARARRTRRCCGSSPSDTASLRKLDSRP